MFLHIYILTLNKITIMRLINKRYLIPIIALVIIFILFILYIFKASPKAVQTSSGTIKYNILVDVEESKLYLFEDGILTKTYKCSGREMVNTITNRNLDYNFKRNMGRRIWTVIGWV